MASCSLGASNTKISILGFGRARVGILQQPFGIRTWPGVKRLQHAGLVRSQRSEKSLAMCFSSSSKIEVATNLEDGAKETKSSGLTSQLVPKSSEVESLLTDICDTTSIAEFELKLSGFRLYIRRDLAEKIKPPPPPIPASLSINTTAQAPDVNGSVSTPSLAITKRASSSSRIQTLLDNAADEGLVILQSPRVGFFRRSRTIKGKRAPPSCKEKHIVKEGQVLCYIEQLGGEIPIESDTSGEVIKILRQDGDPVGYGDALIAILPSFPGIKKLQ